MLKDWAVSAPDVKNARERVRESLRRRLAQLGMSGREFGKHFSANGGKGHGDQWVSNLLGGKFSLSLEELDEAARAVRCTAAELVKSPTEYAEYTTPTEHRIIAAVRALPPAIRDHFLMLAEYTMGVAPDEIDHLMEFRALTAEEKQKIRHWTHALRLAQEPVPGLSVLIDLPHKGERPTDTEHRNRGRRKK